MTRVHAVSTVIGILTVFFTLYAVLGISGNRDAIESLEWDVKFDIPSQIITLDSKIDALKSDIDDIRSSADALKWDVVSVQTTMGSLQLDIEDIRSTLDR